jgi:WD40 repeat protein
MVATASNDHTVRLWSLPSGTPVGVLAGHDDYVYFLDFSTDGRQLVSADAAGVAIVWDVKEQRGRKLAGPPAIAQGARFTSDGQRVGVIYANGDARVWEPSLGTFKALHGHTAQVQAIAVDPMGRFVATGGVAGDVRVWRTPSPSGWTRHVDGNRFHDVAIRDDDAVYVAGALRGEVAAWNRDGELLREGSNPAVGDIYRVYPFGDDVLVHGLRIAIWSLQTGEWRLWDDEQSSDWLVDPSSSGEFLLVGDANAPGCIWLRARSGAEVARGPCRGDEGLREIRLLPGGGTAVSVGGRSHRVDVWNIRRDATQPLVAHSDSVKTIAVWPDASFSTGGMDAVLNYCRLDGGVTYACRRFEIGSAIRRSRPLPGSRRAVLGLQDGRVLLLDPETGAQEVVLQLPKYAHLLAASSDARFIASASSLDNGIYIHDRQAGMRFRLSNHTNGLRELRIENSSHRLVSVSSDRSLRTWDLDQLKAPPRDFAGSQTFASEQSNAVIAAGDQAVTINNNESSTTNNLNTQRKF